MITGRQVKLSAIGLADNQVLLCKPTLVAGSLVTDRNQNDSSTHLPCSIVIGFCQNSNVNCVSVFIVDLFSLMPVMGKITLIKAIGKLETSLSK